MWILCRVCIYTDCVLALAIPVQCCIYKEWILRLKNVIMLEALCIRARACVRERQREMLGPTADL